MTDNTRQKILDRQYDDPLVRMVFDRARYEKWDWEQILEMLTLALLDQNKELREVLLQLSESKPAPVIINCGGQ